MNLWETMWSPIRTWFGGRQTSGTQITGPTGYGFSASVDVTDETALQVTAVWACINLYARTFASMPLRVYKVTDGGRVEDRDHWLAKLMRGKPNQYQTRFEFWEHQIANLVLHGNMYAKKGVRAGRIISLLPLSPLQVETRLVGGKVVHLYTQDGNTDALASDSVWHARMNGDLIVGRSPLQFGRNAIGIAQAAEQVVTKLYTNGGKRSGVLSFDKLLTPEQRQQVRENFTNLTTGTDDRLLVLELGAKFDPISMSPQDIELLQSRIYNNDDIARLFGVPSILINQNEGSTTLGSSTGEIINSFYKTGLAPVAEAVECSLMTHLWGDGDDDYEVEFDFDNFLRASQKERYESYNRGITSGVLKPNEARAMEWLPAAEGGDQLLIQGAMVPVKDAGKTPASNPTLPPQGEGNDGA